MSRKERPPVRISRRLGAGKRFAIVAAAFHRTLTDRLVASARRTLLAHGVDAADVEVVRTPGSLEIPQAALRIARRGKVHAVIGLGVVIRGGTIHFELVAENAVAGLQQAALMSGVPMTSGIVCAETPDQAADRAGRRPGLDRGAEAALAALEMAGLFEHL